MAQDMLRVLKQNLKSQKEKGEDNPHNILENFMNSLKDMPGISDDQRDGILKTLESGFPDNSSIYKDMSKKIQLIMLIGFLCVVALLCGCVIWRLNKSSRIRSKKNDIKVRVDKDEKKIK
ncbi:uncharacterized protein LOC143195192 isoform X1 [Rhynchophorus ferrugineus]|uniref:Uncharacterized protein n=1 Tax=Rhynchophorus ferrugineus TaxID=354439 RepID=A0A834ILT5_RHYFE|nr:hypothetical protein GWI33_005286 [Rhynchophorus ferrugineus]